jgi:endonuclease III
LIDQFISNRYPYKLAGVGLPICCEFFKTIGIDEFKPDVHTTRFFGRIGLVNSAKPKPSEIRDIGIKIAATLGKPRTNIDSLIWNFCADKRAMICTAENPKCAICDLRNIQPPIC